MRGAGAAELTVYGLRLVLPFLPRPELIRPPVCEGGHTLTFRPGAVRPITEPIWQSNDAWRIVVERREESTAIAFADEIFEIFEEEVIYRARSAADVFDLNYNVLAAMILPYARMAPIHAFVIDTPAGRVAITGESGAGKSTLGRELLRRDGWLVADDLLALDNSGLAHAGPPFLRLVEVPPGGRRDSGGKYRLQVPAVPLPPGAISAHVVLDDCYNGPIRLTRMEALDGLLARPYSPVPSRRDELIIRLTALERSIEGAVGIGLPPRYDSPASMADAVEQIMKAEPNATRAD